MGILLKCTLTGLFVMCLSVSAVPEPSRLVAPTLNFAQTKNAPQPQVAVKPVADVVPIYLYARENSLDGDYNFRYETGNGIFAEESGVMLNKGTEDEANSVVGSYRYVSPEGVPIEVTYTAGINGFKAYGAHLPVSPPAAMNLPKSLAYKNVAPSAFARPPQLRALDDSEPSAAVSTGTSPAASVVAYQTTPEAPAYQPTPEGLATYQPTSEVLAAYQSMSKVLGAYQLTSELDLMYQSTPEVPSAYQPTPEVASSNQVQPQGSFVATSQTAAAEVDDIGQVAAVANNAVVQDQAQQVLYVGGSGGGLGSTEKPQVQEPVRVVPLPDQLVRQQLQDSFVRPEHYQQDLSAAVPAVQQQARPVENFESALPPVVPVLQTQAVPVPPRPKVVPVLQRVAYQQQPQQQQQQQLLGAKPVPAVDRQQQHPGSYRQFSIEPQQMWYVPPYQQPGRSLQTGPVKRTLEHRKYN